MMSAIMMQSSTTKLKSTHFQIGSVQACFIHSLILFSILFSLTEIKIFFFGIPIMILFSEFNRQIFHSVE